MISIRPLLGQDLDFLVALEQAVNPSPWSRNQLQDSIENHQGILVLDDKQPLGYAVYFLVADQAELLNIAVVPKNQGQGLGGLLLDYCLNHCKAEAQRFYLEVRASNFAAIRLYLSKGFEKIGERRDYYRLENGREDALLMVYDY